ncbi:MAG TPA: 16S rRNA (guanine(966)-N(2))-methyltransferase RsmD [Gaiellales bacterium]|jgi:16S rRNA (guanine966-N2)-methyltransferase|nr:16S rRNA (guanine(966)-N(2))-methyltransferase RsmD [Gaiellales bacterium]
MRIVAGELGGRRLETPRGRLVRPTAERVREALFARLGPLDGASVLDLFAGSGALGFEALSRGAAACLFADDAAASVACVRQNAKSLGVEERVRVRRADFRRVLRDEARTGSRFDLVLLDPPYTSAPGYAAALGELLGAVLAPGAVIAIESARGLELALDLPADPPRRYGASTIQIIRNAP